MPIPPEVMLADAARIDADDSIIDVARTMRDHQVASVPVVAAGHLVGVVAQCDIVAECVAGGRDPQTLSAGELARRTEATVDVGDSLETALVVMAAHRVRRLPVLDGDTMVGVLSQGDVTRSLAG